MSLFALSSSSVRIGLRPRLHRSAGYRTISTSTQPLMSSTALFAAAALAVGAYAVYVRTSSAQAETTGGKPTFAGFGFRTLKLASSEPVNHNVKHLRFDLPDPQSPTGLTVTSALLAITFPGGRWLPVLRPYTPVNDPSDRGRVDLLVKHYPGGKQSTYLHSLKPGDTVTFFRIPGYSWTANEQAHVGLIAGGQGITPCYQLLRGILTNPADNTRVTLVWGVNTEADLVLADELAALAKKYPGRLTTQYVISAPKEPSSLSASAKIGRVTGDVLKAAGITQGSVGKVFLSGPPPMEKTFMARDGVFAELGLGKKDIHKF